ncbi:MAG: (p)ppGpp synthetase [Desulfuromonadales bacterium]|nr:(p)ppGpp synthetase [Desulfuromonadales bacterium]
MPSLDFDREERAFRKYYDSNRQHLEAAKNAYVSLINACLKQGDGDAVSKIEGRVKDKEECIKKFDRKYRSQLEADEQPYEIRHYISDLIGVRIICLYEDRIASVAQFLTQSFKLIEVTDKITAIESTEDSFGYKGLHMDLALPDDLTTQPKYLAFANCPFEVQIRSLIQDAWSVLDHEIKYKKSIPIELKRRINVLSALFELADREFKEIRNATADLIQQATAAPVSDSVAERDDAGGAISPLASEKIVNAFNFLRIAGHFFKEFEFEDAKVDDFVQDILRLDADFTRADLHQSLLENLKVIRDYRDDFIANNPERIFTPYSSIRHCLYLNDPEIFNKILSKGARERFDLWFSNRRP